MGAFTFKGVFFGENCLEASIHSVNCPGVFLRSDCPGVGQIFSGTTFFVSNHPGDNHSGDLLEGELLMGVTFLRDNFPEDNHQGPNCLGATSCGSNCPETGINIVGQKLFFVI